MHTITTKYNHYTITIPQIPYTTKKTSSHKLTHNNHNQINTMNTMNKTTTPTKQINTNYTKLNPY